MKLSWTGKGISRPPGKGPWVPVAWLATALLGVSGQAAARPVAIGGVIQSSAQDTRMVSGLEMIPVWTLPRLGVAVRNDPLDLRLLLAGRELRYTPNTGWRAVGFSWAGKLDLPQLSDGSLWVPLDTLKALGVKLTADTPELLDFATPTGVPQATLPPSPMDPVSSAPAVTPRPQAIQPVPLPAPPPTPRPAPQPAPTHQASIQPVPVPQATLANLDTVRVSRTMYRSVEVQRVVLELSRAAPYTVAREAGGLSISLTGVTAEASQNTLPSGDEMTIAPTGSGTQFHLSSQGGHSEIFTLDNPFRIVIDTTTYTDASVPPPLDPDHLPDGVTYRNKGLLHLLSFDPGLYQPRVITAPLGQAADVADLVKRAGAVAGVNGGYFDPPTSLPVDLVAVNGLMTASSLERRATIGFTPGGDTLIGYTRPRYYLLGPFGSVMVNSVRPQPDRNLLTAFVGDGKTKVGADMLTTLYLTPGATTVGRALTGEVIPPTGTVAFTFDPQKYPQLPRTAGADLSFNLNWRAQNQSTPWGSALDALSAGPLLVQDSKVVLDPDREGFNTGSNVWRPTRQVAIGTLGGQPTIAYFEYGTPEAFAAALAGAGMSSAVRLDSGSSATAYVLGGYANLGAYLNTVWSRPVPNAIVFVPKGTTARK